MSITSQFAYLRATNTVTPPALVDMKRLMIDPVDLPLYQPYGQPYRQAIGSVRFSSLPKLSLLFPYVPMTRQADGTTSTVGTTTELYEEFRLSVAGTRQLFWIHRWWPDDDAFAFKLCVMLWPDYSGNVTSIGIQNLIINLVGIGLNPNTYIGGEASPPTNKGDPYEGGFGYGVFGKGGFGQGSL